MYQFFSVVREKGLRQQDVANWMGVTPFQFTRTKSGVQEPSVRFMREAVRALKENGIRKGDGTEYTVEELFFAPLEEPALAGV